MSLRKLSLKTLLINLMLLGLLFLGISIEAKAGQQSQAPFFDLATFKEIIEGAQNPVSISIHDEELIAQTADKIKDFLTSTNFAFNDHISHSILRNGQLFVEAFREIRIKFQIGHRNYSQIVDPKFRLDIVPNINFLKALISPLVLLSWLLISSSLINSSCMFTANFLPSSTPHWSKL